MGKMNATLKRVIETLNSHEFKAHIHQTLLGMPEHAYQPLIIKLISHARQGDRDKWCGMLISPVEFRIGYQSNGICYTQVITNGEVRCYDFGKVKS